MKKKINPTRVPLFTKESQRWLDNILRTHSVTNRNPQKLIHIGDREADIYELLMFLTGINSVGRLKCISKF
jgi:hypothetical protein